MGIFPNVSTFQFDLLYNSTGKEANMLEWKWKDELVKQLTWSFLSTLHCRKVLKMYEISVLKARGVTVQKNLVLMCIWGLKVKVLIKTVGSIKREKCLHVLAMQQIK